MNLLTDPLLRVVTREGLKTWDLPQVLEGLGDEQVISFPGLQRHQEDAWYVFLCYLAGAVLSRHGRSDPKQSADFWREGLRQLAGNAGDDAWRLVVDDLAKPAFLQPPLPTTDRNKLKPLAFSPDALDLLPTAKNHDLKQDRAQAFELDEWVFALVSLQTMSGYYGRGNPGIARMNSGFGNRPVVEICHRRSFSGRFCDALPRLLDHRRRILEGEWHYNDTGLVLTWIEPWDGASSLALDQLDPFFLEVCRRVRLRRDPLRAEVVPSQANRVAAKQLNGVVGDAWLPVDLRSEIPKALTVPASGWTAELLRSLVFEDGFELTALHRPMPGVDGPVWLVASVLVRGQGTTDGFHQREVFIPAEARRRLFLPSDQRANLAELARNAIEFAGTVQRKVLKPAFFAYLQAGRDKLDFDDATAQTTWERFGRHFEELWSDRYFPWLWSIPEPVDKDKALRDWVQYLKRLGEQLLDEIERTLPTHEGRRYKAITACRRFYYGRLYRLFPELRKEEEHVA